MSMEFIKEYTLEDEDYGRMEVECDDCGNDDGEDGSFRECIRWLKDRGWEFKYHGRKDYTHHCPDRKCKRKRSGTLPPKTRGQVRRDRQQQQEQKNVRRSRRRR